MSAQFKKLTGQWFEASVENRYSYNFTWLGRPVIQYPQDLVAMQEIIWEVQPDLIIETGIAHGGSLIFSASMLELNAICGGPTDAVVLGIDIDIREHNRIALEAHPLFRRISTIEGSSIDQLVIDQVVSTAQGKKNVMVFLDSNHTHAHVLAELRAYAHLTSIGSYCVVFDTVIDDLPSDVHKDRPWGPNDNPKTAVHEFLSRNPNFVSEESIDRKLLISVAPEGYLRRIS
jgi:cephalosporin hydroxylase